MITRLDEMRANEQMEQANRRQRSYEDAMGIIHPPPIPPGPPMEYPSTGIMVNYAEEDRKTEARWAERRKQDDELWQWYLDNRDPNIYCACGRFKTVCWFSQSGFHRTRTMPRVIFKEDQP